ncbi:MAG TPA: quinone-dependent dihydroorotate dehydrogenase [Elusimicrobiales bacterium]|nr:quinone-dependent dihydroorotate dehydrogenase [Elusimicrobiales bacterium]
MKTIDFLYKKIVRPIAFKIGPETVHDMAILKFKIASNFNFFKKIVSNYFTVNSPISISGLNFKNPIGLAAGFDKNGEAYDFLKCLGFGFIEIGSVTLKPQKGNPKPRLWRIPEEKALINHFGLNNIGAYGVLKNIEKKGKEDIVLGINIAKNNDCESEIAHKNISECFKILKDAGDFFVINISCPNVKGFTEGLKDYSKKIIESVKEIDDKKILFIKISPDISDDDLKDISELCEKTKTGIVASNTTKRKDLIKTRAFDSIEGGLSGKPLGKLNLQTIEKIRSFAPTTPIISSGGIFDKNDIELRKKAGANLFEIYTSFIYEGPLQVRNLLGQ